MAVVTLKDHEAAIAATPIPQELDTPAFREAWDMWNRHRQEIRAYQTKTSAMMQMRKLCAMGAEKAVQTIEYCVEHQWRGLFDPPAACTTMTTTVRLDGNQRF